MLRWVVVLAFALTACSQASGNQVAKATASPTETAVPSTNQSPSPGPTPSTAPVATPIADLPLTTLGFSCRLPVSTPDGKGGFIRFPSASVSFDPTGAGGHYFDRAFSRWLPVGRSQVSPDGAHSAYAEIGQPDEFFVHIVDVATGTDHPYRELASATGISAGPSVFDYSVDGIYLVQAFEHIWPGVYLFDHRTGSIHKAADVERPELIVGGALWFGQVNSADPNPFSSRSSAGIFPDEVGRFDLRSGSRTQWLYRPGIALDVLGVDLSGRPLIPVLAPGNDPGIGTKGFFDHSASELMIGLNSTSQRSIYKGQIVETLTYALADSHGVWLGGRQGIYLYSEANGLQKVSDQPGNQANGCF